MTKNKGNSALRNLAIGGAIAGTLFATEAQAQENHAPVCTPPAIAATVQQDNIAQVPLGTFCTDEDGDGINYTGASVVSPSGVPQTAVNISGNKLVFDATDLTPGDYNVLVRMADVRGAAASEVFKVKVTSPIALPASGSAPVATVPAAQAQCTLEQTLQESEDRAMENFGNGDKQQIVDYMTDHLFGDSNQSLAYQYSLDNAAIRALPNHVENVVEQWFTANFPQNGVVFNVDGENVYQFMQMGRYAQPAHVTAGGSVLHDNQEDANWATIANWLRLTDAELITLMQQNWKKYNGLDLPADQVRIQRRADGTNCGEVLDVYWGNLGNVNAGGHSVATSGYLALVDKNGGNFRPGHILIPGMQPVDVPESYILRGAIRSDVLNQLGIEEEYGTGVEIPAPVAPVAPVAPANPCGNGTCDPGENYTTCPVDCVQPDAQTANTTGIDDDPYGDDTEEPLTACSNQIDDDADGPIDMEDPGCESPEDDDETNPIVEPPVTPPETQPEDDAHRGPGLSVGPAGGFLFYAGGPRNDGTGLLGIDLRLDTPHFYISLAALSNFGWDKLSTIDDTVNTHTDETTAQGYFPGNHPANPLGETIYWRGHTVLDEVDEQTHATLVKLLLGGNIHLGGDHFLGLGAGPALAIIGNKYSINGTEDQTEVALGPNEYEYMSNCDQFAQDNGISGLTCQEGTDVNEHRSSNQYLLGPIFNIQYSPHKNFGFGVEGGPMWDLDNGDVGGYVGGNLQIRFSIGGSADEHSVEVSATTEDEE